MKLVKKILMLAFAASVAASIAACGGGGAGEGSPSQPVSGDTGLTVSFSANSLTFDLMEGQPPVTRIMTGSASGSTDKEVLIGAEVTGTGLELPIRVSVNATTRVATITVTSAKSLPAGTYTGTIKMMACTTQDCTRQHAGSPHMVNYTVNVAANLRPSVSSLQLAATEAANTTVTPITVTLPPNTTLAATTTYNPGASGWLTAEVNGSTVNVQASTRNLAAGTYSATLALRAQGGTQSVELPITLTVASALSMSEGAVVKLQSTSNANLLSGTIPLALGTGTTANAWSASSDATWLKLDRASGDFSTSPAWHIDVNAVTALANNASHNALVTVVPNGGLQAHVYKLTVQKALAEIKGLDTYALLAGQAGEVLVYGSGFNAVGSNVSLVKVGDRNPSAVTLLNDSVLRLTLPVMSAGTYPVSISSPAGLSMPPKSLRVTSSDNFTYQALATTGAKTQLLWDAGSKSAYAIDQENAKVLRYSLANGTLELAASRNFADVEALGMSADASYLVVTPSNKSRVYKLALNDLGTIGELDSSYRLPYSMSRRQLAILGDNRMMLHNAWLDLDTGLIVPFAKVDTDWGLAFWAAVSGNGMRMIRPDSGTLSPRYDPTHFDLASQAYGYYKNILYPYFYDYAVDRTGENWVLDGNVVIDFDWKEKGYVALPEGWLGNYSAISRNGSRVYRYAIGGNNYEKARIYAFDTTVAVGAGGRFPILGYIELPELAGCKYNATVSDSKCNWARTQIAITKDDQNLLLAGDVKIMVVPIPANYRANASARQAGPVLSGDTRLPGKR